MSCCGEREWSGFIILSLSLLCYCFSQRAAQCIIHGSVLHTALSLSISLFSCKRTERQAIKNYARTHTCVLCTAIHGSNASTSRVRLLLHCSMHFSLHLSVSLSLSLSPAAAITLSGPQRAHMREALHVRSRYCPLLLLTGSYTHQPRFRGCFLKLHIQKQGGSIPHIMESCQTRAGGSLFLPLLCPGKCQIRRD